MIGEKGNRVGRGVSLKVLKCAQLGADDRGEHIHQHAEEDGDWRRVGITIRYVPALTIVTVFQIIDDRKLRG